MRRNGAGVAWRGAVIASPGVHIHGPSYFFSPESPLLCCCTPLPPLRPTPRSPPPPPTRRRCRCRCYPRRRPPAPASARTRAPRTMSPRGATSPRTTCAGTCALLCVFRAQLLQVADDDDDDAGVCVINSPVYEYPLNGQWIMMDIDDGYILWTGIWKGASVRPALFFARVPCPC